MGNSSAARRLIATVLVATAVTLVTVLAPADVSAPAADARPWLGIAMDKESPPSSPGVRVGHVVRGSPADKAGVHQGDRILRVAGASVATGADVVRTVGQRGVGAVVDITLERAGKEQTVHVTLAPFPSQDDMMRMDLVGAFAPAWTDISVVSGSFPSSVAAARGHVVVLDFWATWCGPCRVVIPKLDALQARFGAQGLNVLGLSTEDEQDVAVFTQRMSMRYGVGIDRKGQTTRSYGVGSLPTLVVIDKRGVVRDVAIGYDPSEDAHLDTLVRELLAEPTP